MNVASLPMYDWPEIRPYTDDFWQAFAHYAGLEGELQRSGNHSDIWHSEKLQFSQTCGYPYTHDFNGLLTYVATPHYRADGCLGAEYCSIIFARDAGLPADFYGCTSAINSPDSMSGMLALKLVFAPYTKGGEFFGRTTWSGSHRNSLTAVRTKYADVCAVDAVCVALLRKYCPQELDGLVEIARSPSVPALPFVTRAGNPAKLVEALTRTFADPQLKTARDGLLLSGFSVLPQNAYDRITDLESALPAFEL